MVNLGSPAERGNSPGYEVKWRDSMRVRQPPGLRRPPSSQSTVEEEPTGGTSSPTGVQLERLAFVLLSSVGWIACAWAALKFNQFPFHRHRTELAWAMCGPPVVFWLVVALIELAVAPPAMPADAKDR